ncbi:hypothetical protein BDR07DRAFT_1377703 [Suillus spraguei]|nr:hypothetical protein BDR07DRAFT_1377703 [Suillus spraguei]
MRFEPGERTLGLGEWIFFVPGDRVILDAPDGVRCSLVRARGEDLEGVMVEGACVEGFEGVLFGWGLDAEGGGTVVGVLSVETVLVREAVSLLPNTDAELEVAELAVRTRTDGDEGLCFAGLGDVKLMGGLVEARLTEERLEADKEREKALGGPALGRFKSVGVVESMFEVEFEFEIGLAGFTVVHPLASLVIDSARVLREVREIVKFDVVRDNDKRERVEVSDGVGILVQWLVTGVGN